MKKDILCRHQDITDMPPQLMLNGKLCNFYLEYGECGRFWDPERLEDRSMAYLCGYRSVETGERVINSGGNSIDWAISNLFIRFTHSSLEVCRPDGTELWLVPMFGQDHLPEKESTIEISRCFIFKDAPVVPEEGKLGLWHRCPYCGSSDLESEPYDTLCPEALAGSKGTYYTCKKCGYHWDECYMMS